MSVTGDAACPSAELTPMMEGFDRIHWRISDEDRRRRLAFGWPARTFSPIARIVPLSLKAYDVTKVVGDHYGGEFVKEPFRWDKSAMVSPRMIRYRRGSVNQ
jgi:hypothetical protein